MPAKDEVNDHAAIKGNRGVWVLRRVQNATAGFLLISLRESYDAIKAFAGPQYENALYYLEDTKSPLELGPHMATYEVLSTT